MGKRIRAQRKGSSPRYRVSSHRFPGANRMPREMDVVGEVTELVHSPVHTAPLARVKLPDGDTTLVVATEGVAIGSQIAIGDNVSLRPGNITPLSEIPEGTAINNVELRPGDGGKLPVLQETPVSLKPSWRQGPYSNAIRFPQGTSRHLSSHHRCARWSRP